MVYNKEEAFDSAKDYIIWQDNIQNEIFKAIANTTGSSFESIDNE